MKVIPTLNQKIESYEYVYARGYKSFSDASAALDCMIPEEISPSENPRIVQYKSTIGFVLYAIVLTDHNLKGYM